MSFYITGQPYNIVTSLIPGQTYNISYDNTNTDPTIVNFWYVLSNNYIDSADGPVIGPDGPLSTNSVTSWNTGYGNNTSLVSGKISQTFYYPNYNTSDANSGKTYNPNSTTSILTLYGADSDFSFVRQQHVQVLTIGASISGWGVVGFFTGWGSTTDKAMTETYLGSNIFSYRLNFNDFNSTKSDSEREIKFRNNNNFANNLGSSTYAAATVLTSSGGYLVREGGNLTVPILTSDYVVSINFNNYTYDFEPYNFEPYNVPVSGTCFPAGTPISTNQGDIPIEEINPKIHTIRNKKIVRITKTVTLDKTVVCFEKNALGNNIPSQKTIVSNNHGIFYKGDMIQAHNFAGKTAKITKIKYSGEILYNVLMEEPNKMMVNNLICETLHPNHPLVKLYNSVETMNAEERNNCINNNNQGYTNWYNEHCFHLHE